jgi:hypothetical protein
MARLQNEDLEHQDVIVGRTTAFGPLAAWHRALQVRSEDLEIHDGIQPLEVIALGRQLLQPLVDIEQPQLTAHPALHRQIAGSESQDGSKRWGF